jgi:acyl-CoA thioesterase I
LLLIAACGSARAAAPSDGASERPLRIVAFGSSSTQGVGATTAARSYPSQLQDVLKRLLPRSRAVEVINRGIGGEDADDMTRRLRTDVIARRPDVVIWQTGSNDPFHHVPLARFIAETRAGIAAMRAAGIAVILMEPQWCPRLDAVPVAGAYRDAVRAVGLDMHVDVVRRSDLMRDWLSEGRLTAQQLLSADGFHMTDGGYALLARSVAPEILKVENLRPALAPTAVR